MFKFKNQIMIMLTLLVCIAITISSMADDTEIYGTNSVTVRPNVLIIFDTSWSMAMDDNLIVGELYKSSKVYANYPDDGYTPDLTNSIYYKESSKSTWSIFPYTVGQISGSCLSNLTTNGILTSIGISNLSKNSRACNKFGTKYDFKTSNYINYENSTFLTYRYEVAQTAMAKLVKDNTDKNFGLMTFNDTFDTANRKVYYEGGKLIFPCSPDLASNTALHTYISNMDRDDFHAVLPWNPSYNPGRGTPLAETLAEAGLYFGGKDSWFTPGLKYTSPITKSCQANYIIYMTDGDPTSDTNPMLWDTVYMNNKKIGDFDGDSNEVINEDNELESITNASGYSHFLDDVALFLYDEDVFTKTDNASADAAYDAAEGKQNIRTFTIGFTTDQDLLEKAGSKGGGGGKGYYTANNAQELANVLLEINNSINATSSVFLAPSIPVNRTSKTDQSDWIYLAFFKPQFPGEWLGNIKKFALGKNGEIYGRDTKSSDPNAIDKSQNVVDELGQVKSTACSFWTVNCSDGNEATSGGLGQLLQSNNPTSEDNTRTIYCYTGTENSLLNSSNVFNDTNTALLTLMDKTNINAVRDFTSDWKLGAIIHSEPLIVHYTNTQSVIYVGANDGMLHCFDDTTGSELWGFVPPGQITNLIGNIGDSLHNYYVDGSPVVTYGELINGTQHYQPKYMIFGERRGGNNYYVIDITNHLAPEWKYQIEPDILGASETLGQSWCKPVVCTMATKTDKLADGSEVPGGLTEVFLISGGYDAANQDNEPPTSTKDTYGKAIFAVNTSTGTLTSSSTDGSLPLFKVTDLTEITGISAVDNSYIKNCIVDVKASSTVESSTGKDITTRIYAGDMGGNVYAFSDDMYIDTVKDVKTLLKRVPNGNFPIKLCLFSAPGKKIFYAPGVSRINNTFSEYVVFGTGDREKPKMIVYDDDSAVQNGIYVVKNTWLNETPYTESDLTDLTENVLSEGSSDKKKEVANALSKSHGWYINFWDAGEKMISKPIVTNGYIYFTTYVPPGAASATSDPCKVGKSGATYLWSIELETGIPVHDTNNDGKKEKEERRRQVAVMAQPTLSGDLISTPSAEVIPGKINSNYFFWRQR